MNSRDIKQQIREALLSEGLKMSADIPIPNNVRVLSNIFSDNGYELYLVGGAVRDFLMGNPIKDYDLATNAVPDEIEFILHKEGLKTVATGKHFGIINAFVEGDEFEIATFRSDSDSGDGRRPDSVTFTDIKTDVNRRDLTINALFYNLATREIVDYVGGIEDIRNGVIRTVGEPAKRFEEDKLRILRAIRFAARTGKDLDPKIDDFLRNGYDLYGVSQERIRDEFIKSIKSAVSVSRLMETYYMYDMFEWIFPGLEINTKWVDVNDEIIVIATLLIPNRPNETSIRLNELRYSKEEFNAVKFLVSLTHLSTKNAPIVKKMEAKSGVSQAQILNFGSINDINKNLLDAFSRYELSINGYWVMQTYKVRGEEVGDMILNLERLKFEELL